MLWYSLEAPHQGTSNEYPQYMFSRRNKKNIIWIPALIWRYENAGGNILRTLSNC